MDEAARVSIHDRKDEGPSRHQLVLEARSGAEVARDSLPID